MFELKKSVTARLVFLIIFGILGSFLVLNEHVATDYLSSTYLKTSVPAFNIVPRVDLVESGNDYALFFSNSPLAPPLDYFVQDKSGAIREPTAAERISYVRLMLFQIEKDLNTVIDLVK